MSAPDIAGVLAKALPRALHDALRCNCDSGEAHYWQAEEMAPTVADAIRAELRAWLESEGAVVSVARAVALNNPGEFAADDPLWTNDARAALAALAEQVGRVDPSQSESGSTGIEVCQSADQTSTAGVEG